MTTSCGLPPLLGGLLVAAISLAGCAQMVVAEATKKDSAAIKECLQSANNSPDAQIIYRRLWKGDASDTAAKLSDPEPLTPAERDALVRLESVIAPCRQMILDHDNRYAAWEAPYWQEYFERSDAIRLKLAAGEIPVGLANRLFIETRGHFQTEVSRGHANAVAIEEERQQRASEAMLQASSTILANSRTQTTNCTFLGNTLNCMTR
jgi:hypothetical protein